MDDMLEKKPNNMYQKEVVEINPSAAEKEKPLYATPQNTLKWSMDPDCNADYTHQLKNL